MPRERRFVNERLVTVRRFKPGTPEPAGGVTASGSLPSADLGQILHREQTALDAGLQREHLDEFARRRAEVSHELETALLQAEQQRQGAEEDIQQLLEWKLKLDPAQGLDPATAAPADLRGARRAVEEVHLELLQCLRSPEGAEAGSTPRPAACELLSLSLGQMTRLGLGFTWPLIAAIVLAGLAVAVSLLAVF